MANQPYRLTDKELDLVNLSLLGDFARGHDARLFTDYWFNGWLFDYKIEPPWQLRVHHAKQTQIVIIGGAGSGKTVFKGISAAVWAASTHHFKFMNVAPTQYQSRQMFDAIMSRAEGTRFTRLIAKSVEKPYPKIVLRHSGIGESTLEFMSTDKNANKILSFEGDWINYDEGGLDDELDQTLPRLSTRLRGSIHGRSRLGRFSLTTNPHINPQLYYLFDMAEADPEHCLSVLVKTRSNKNITDEQIRQMVSHITDERERERWLDGRRPEGAGKEFPDSLVSLCQDAGLDDIMQAARELQESLWTGEMA